MNVFELFKESYGVGVVASKNQTKDPRYSHSLTVDVKPDTSKKNRKALGLSEEVGKQSEDDDYLLSLLAQIGAAEGQYTGTGSQNPKSTAKGRYQFTQGTWAGIQKNIENGSYKNYGIDPDLLKDIANTSFDNMADGNNPDFSKRIQDAAALVGAKENALRLEKAGINVDRDNLYKTWALGPGTGIKVIQAQGTGKSMENIYKEIYGADAKDDDNNLKWKKQLDLTKKQNPTWFAKGDSAEDINVFLNNHITKLNKGKDAPEVNVAKSDTEQATVSTTPGAAKAEPEYDAFGNVVTAKGFDPDNKKAQQAANSVARQARRDDAVNAELGGADSAGSAYSIKPGDTLRTIAKNNGTTVDALMKANPQIKDANSINAGAKKNHSLTRAKQPCLRL
mgnify:CR=1 FL=1